MALRVTAAEVKEIVSTELDDDIILVLAGSANLIVTAQLGGLLGADLLKEIERWLTAHIIKMSWERQTVREEIGGDTNEQYSRLGLSLDASTYGQTVKMLDSTGKLANLGKRKSIIEAVTSWEE